ncbi:hypothetical protein [Mycobacteroides abscessus]|uniref:hypothetical protein n=1 Tax=Mycobacteroides abscessus TaxID=36809 RepID=UPI00266BF241|nr:hypothetical protein [Mycobacteroides abscessus]MDO3061726.1 hypothetical protein [Mycobacteroides abscessus subsp. abscessus]MDO3277734.1 hypothetical protein [Mycobacteroides abscessus subsp. abscessus]
MITVSTCAYGWCTNAASQHLDHYSAGEVTAALDDPKSAVISCGVDVELGGKIYNDEIIVVVRSVGQTNSASLTVGEGIGLSLTVAEAQQLRDLLDVAMANREEIRGRVG